MRSPKKRSSVAIQDIEIGSRTSVVKRGKSFKTIRDEAEKKSVVWLIVTCSCVLLSWGAENKSLSEKVEKKAVVTKDLTAEEARRQSSYKPPLRNIPTPGSDHGLVDEYPPGPSTHSGGYGSPHTSPGYAPSSGPSGYSPQHASGGYDSSYPSSGYDSSHSSGGYGSPHPSSGYGSSHPSSESYSKTHSSSGSSSPQHSGYGSPPHSSSGYGSSPYSSGGHSSANSGDSYGSRPSKSYRPSHLSSGYGSSHPSSGQTSYSPSGYSQPHYPHAHSPVNPSYNPPPPSSSAHYSGPSLGGYREYGPESIRELGPIMSHGSLPYANGGYLNIGSGVKSGSSGQYPSSYESSGYAKAPVSYGEHDSYTKPGGYGNGRKYATSEENYPKLYKNRETASGGYRNPLGSKNRKRSNRQNGYSKAPLSSSDPLAPYDDLSKPSNDYNNPGKQTPNAYGGYKSSRGYGSYHKPANDYRSDYDRQSIDYSKPTGQRELYDSYSQAQKPRSYSKLVYDEPSSGSAGYDKRKHSDDYSRPASGYEDNGKRASGYTQPLGPSDYDKLSAYKAPAYRYAGFSKPAGSGGASQYDGGYGGYATGPPAGGYGDYSKIAAGNSGGFDFGSGGGGGNSGNIGNSGSRGRPSLSGQRGLGVPPATGFNKAYGQITQSGYSKSFSSDNGSPNLSGYDLGGDGFSHRGLMGNHGLYGTASYGRNYGVDRYGDLNKGYSGDQSIYGGYSHLY